MIFVFFLVGCSGDALKEDSGGEKKVIPVPSPFVLGDMAPINTINGESFSLSGTCHGSVTVTLRFFHEEEESNTVEAEVTCTDGEWSAEVQGLSSLSDGEVTLQVLSQGVEIVPSVTLVKDTVIPVFASEVDFDNTNLSLLNFTVDFGGTCADEDGTVTVAVQGDMAGLFEPVSGVCSTQDGWSFDGVDFSSLPDGEYTIEISFLDHAQNPAATTVTGVILRDTQPPLIGVDDLSSLPINSVNQVGYTLGGECEDDSTLALSINGVPAQASLNPVCDNNTDRWSFSMDASLLPEGTYVVTVDATDPAGNTASAQRSVIKNISPPTIQGELGVPPAYSGTEPGYGPGASLVFTVTFSEDVQVTGTPRIPLTLTHAGGTPRDVYAHYDSSQSQGAEVVFTYTVESAQRGTLALNGGIDLQGTGGIHDLYGNPSAAVASFSSVPAAFIGGNVVVDASAVVISSIAATPAGAKKSGDTLTLTATFTEGVDVDMSLGTPALIVNVGGDTSHRASYSGATATNVSTMGFSFPVPAGDDDQVTVEGIELNGGTIQRSGTTKSVVLTGFSTPVTGLVVDNTIPEVTITRQGAGWQWSCDNGENCEYRSLVNVNSSAQESDFSSETYGATDTASPPAIDGNYYVHIQAKDDAGNTVIVSSTDFIAADTTPPVIRIVLRSDGTTGWQWSCDNGESCTFRHLLRPDNILQESSFSGAYGGTDRIEVPNSDGVYYVHVQAKDDAGNMATAVSPDPITVDTTPPRIVVRLINSGTGWEWFCDNGESCEYRYIINDVPTGATYQGPYSSSSTSVTPSGDGTHYLHVEARDEAGNIAVKDADDSILIDTVDPEVTITLINGGTGWEWSCDNGESCTYRHIVSTSPSATPSDFLLISFGNTIRDTPTSEGVHYVHVQARDAGGNTVIASSAAPITVAPPPVGVDNLANTPGLGWSWGCTRSSCEYRYAITDQTSHLFDSADSYGSSTSAEFFGPGSFYIHIQARSGTEEADSVTSSGVATIISQRKLPSLSVANRSACVVGNDQTAQCWGSAAGMGTRPILGSLISAVPTARAIPDVENVIQVATGETHTCYLSRESGGRKAYCYGAQDYGALGNNEGSGQSVAPSQVGGGSAYTDYMQVDTGWDHSCALRSSGRVYCWGYGSEWAIGNGSSSHALTPTQVLSSGTDSTPLTGIIQVSTGNQHSCALHHSGGVYCWGSGGSLQTGGTVGGSNSRPRRVLVNGGSWLTGVVQVEAGDSFSCALQETGGVLCWGDGAKLGDGPSPSDSGTPVSVLREAGVELGDVVQISLGADHACALQSSGHVWCWGDGANGRLGDGSRADHTAHYAIQVRDETNTAGQYITNIEEVVAGFLSTCARDYTGRVLCWGRGGYCRLGNNICRAADNGGVSPDMPYPVSTLTNASGNPPLRIHHSSESYYCTKDSRCKEEDLRYSFSTPPVGMSTNSAPSLDVSGRAGREVNFYNNSSCSDSPVGTILSDAVAGTGVTLSLGSGQGIFPIHYKVSDEGLESTCSEVSLPYGLDNQAPQVVNITSLSSGNLVDGDILEFEVSFDENVTAMGTPQVGLLIGGNTRVASYDRAGSDGSVAIFSYSVVTGDVDLDGVELANDGDFVTGSLDDATGNSTTSLGSFTLTGFTLGN